MTNIIHTKDASDLHDWFHVRFHKAVSSLKDTVTALDQVLIMGKCLDENC